MNIGMEIEFTGVKRVKVAEGLGNLWGNGYKQFEYPMFDGTTRLRYSVKDVVGNIWTIVRDMSIRPDCAHGHITLDYDEYMCELVSPVIKNERDIDMLKDALSYICSIGGFVNETCGVHIHIDCPTSGEDVYKIFNLVVNSQHKLISDFGVPYNRINRYCQLYPQEFIEGMRSWHDDCLKEKGYMSISDIQSYLYKELGNGCDRNDPKNPSRYFIFNLDSIHKLNTLEFRWFNSTLSFIIVDAYVKTIHGLLGDMLWK